eukprot:3148232-Pyramimonas_sp.AAC.1
MQERGHEGNGSWRRPQDQSSPGPRCSPREPSRGPAQGQPTRPGPGAPGGNDTETYLDEGRSAR